VKVETQLSDLDESTRPLSESTLAVRPESKNVTPSKIDRMDNRGFFTSHFTRDGKQTLCGLDLQGRAQPWCNNGFCRRCEKIAARCQNSTPAASGEQMQTNPSREALEAMTYEQWLDHHRVQPGGWLTTAAPDELLRATYEQRRVTFDEMNSEAD